MRSIHILFYIALISFTIFSSAASLKKKKISLSEEISSIKVQAHHAHINLYPLKKAKTKMVEIKKNSSDVEIEEEDSVLLISEKSFPSKRKAWKVRKKQIINIGVPALPVKVFLFSGQVQVKGITQNLSISLLGDGTVDTKQTRGKLNLFQKQGSLKVSAHNGTMSIQSESAKINLSECQGNMKIRSFKNMVSVAKSKGELFIKTFKSPLNISNFRGSLDFKQKKGGVYLKKVRGLVDGYSEEGEIKGMIYAKKVKVETHTGRIHLDFPASRAWVSAETWDGKISSPIYFYRTKTGGMDRAKGKLKGVKRKNKLQQGNIVLKSRSGSIRFYQSH